MIAIEDVIGLHVSVEALGQRGAMQHRKVVRLAEGVHRELPVEPHLIAVRTDIHEIAESPRFELRRQTAQELLRIDGSLRIGMHPQQAVTFDGG